MNSIEKSQLIDENILDQGYYFQSLFLEACQRNILSDAQIERIQVELIELMGKEVERYTNDESSSVPVEKAQELLQSITYSMGCFLKTISDMEIKINLLKSEKLSVLFHKGMEAVSACKARARKLMQELQNNSLKLDNYAYQDSIFTGIPEFFHDYNIEFGANETSASIDYPIFFPIADLLGAEYMEEYLKRFTLENNYCRHFSEKTMNQLLHGFDKEAEHILINIFELVLINSMGCGLLGQEITTLEISKKDMEWLQNSMEGLNLNELVHKLEDALSLVEQEVLLEKDILAYMKAAIPEISERFKNNLNTHTLDKLFVSFKEDLYSGMEIFEDGIPMGDEDLRNLIERISECTKTSEKMAIIKETVRSRADLTELLEECFYGDEFTEVFDLLGVAERSLLLKGLLIDEGIENLEDYEPQKEWQIWLTKDEVINNIM
jgi:hypothetical protein